MTANGPTATNGFSGLKLTLQRSMRTVSRMGLGILVLLAAGLAGFVALITALFGIIVAMTAVLMQSVFGRTTPRATVWKNPEPDTSADNGSGDAFTIDARRSPEGWTVE